MTATKLIITILFEKKWIIIIPPIVAAFFALFLVMKAEPVYVSVSKLWLKERTEESNLLKVNRSGPQEDTYIKVQKQIMTSNPILEAVVHELDLIDNPPPSQSMWAQLFGLREEESEELGEREAMSWALKKLRSEVWIDVVNPEILVVGCKTNDPELARLVTESVLKHYREQYFEILIAEVNQYKIFLSSQLSDLEAEVDRRQNLLSEFEMGNPLVSTSEAVSIPTELQGAPTMGLARDVSEVSPVPQIQRDIFQLELDRTRLLSRYNESSNEISRIDADLERKRDILRANLAGLSQQAKLALEHERLKWEVLEARRQYSAINSEYHKILLSEGTKVKQTGSITTLEQPSYNPEAIAPKKKVVLLAAMFLGGLFGVGMTYLLALANGAYVIPEELSKDQALPLLATFSDSDLKN